MQVLSDNLKYLIIGHLFFCTSNWSQKRLENWWRLQWKSVNISWWPTLPVTELVIQYSHRWITKFGGQKPRPLEKDAIYCIWNVPKLENIVFLPYYSWEQVHRTFKCEQYKGKVVELQNFIHARGLNHRWFISLLQQMDAEHTEVSCYLSVHWLSSRAVLKIVQGLHEEIIMILHRKF